MDLMGNTYWEFRDQLNATRYRRIVKYNPKTHYADVKINRTFPGSLCQLGLTDFLKHHGING